MEWYLTTAVDAKPMGPFPEEYLVEMIRSGARIAAVHAKGVGEWVAPETHAAFAEAQRKNVPPDIPIARVKNVPRHSKLQGAAYICIVLGFLMYAGDSIVDRIQVLMGASTGLDMSSYSTAEAAVITLTNRRSLTQWGCFRGVVTSKSTIGSVLSAVVCTGEMKPMTTASLSAPYPPGKVQKLCSLSDRDDRGVFDWNLCDFEIVDGSHWG